MDRGAWWAAVHGVAKSRTWLRDFTFTFHFHALEKEMATHSSVLAWRIPGAGEPGGLPSMGSHRVRHDWSDLAVAASASALTREVWLHRDHDKSIACRFMSEPYQWVASNGELYNYFYYISQCNNNRYKVHTKCNVLESSWNRLPPTPGPWKNWHPQNWSLVPKRLEMLF